MWARYSSTTGWVCYCDYDVGTVLKYDGLGVLLRLRLTSGPVTVRDSHVFSAWVMVDGNRHEFDKQLIKFVAKVGVEFATHFVPAQGK
jgi:hypothetical protein